MTEDHRAPVDDPGATQATQAVVTPPAGRPAGATPQPSADRLARHPENVSDRGPGLEDTAEAGASSGDPGAPRQVRLTAARVNPWSVLKLSFLLSVALGVAFVVAVFVLWSVLDAMGVFTDVGAVLGEVVGGSVDLTRVVGLSRVLSLAVVVAVVDVVLLTVMATLGAVLYNICSALVGGVRLTLTDD